MVASSTVPSVGSLELTLIGHPRGFVLSDTEKVAKTACLRGCRLADGATLNPGPGAGMNTNEMAGSVMITPSTIL